MSIIAIFCCCDAIGKEVQKDSLATRDLTIPPITYIFKSIPSVTPSATFDHTEFMSET